MRKLVSLLLVVTFIFKFIIPINFVWDIFAVSNNWDFSTPGDYTLSDSNKLNIVNNTIKLKSTLSSVGRLNNWPTLLDQATNIEVSWNYAYITSYGSNAIQIIDISNSSLPVHAASIAMSNTNKLNWAYDLLVDWNYLYVASYIDDDIEIIDISTPTAPFHVTNIANSASTKLNWPRWLDINGNYMYVASYSDDAIQIIDISVPTVPVSKWYLSHATRLDAASWIKIKWNYAYVTSYSKDRLQVIDISDPDLPVFAWQLLDNTWGSRLNGAWWIDIKWNYAYISSYVDDTLEIVDISIPSAPVHYSHVRNTVPGTRLNWPRNLKIDWNYVYITSFVDDAVQIIDITNPLTPVVNWNIRDTTRLNWASWIFISWNTAFATSSELWALQTINIINKSTPVFLWELLWWNVRLWGSTNIIIDWNYAYVSAYLSNSIQVIDISDRTNPVHVSVLSANNTIKLRWVYDLQKVWNYLYAATYTDDSLTVVDVTNPLIPNQVTNIRYLANTRELNGARWIHVVWNYAYIASYNSDALQIIDITNPLSLVARWFLKDNTRLDRSVDVKVKWNYAYVSSYQWDRIQVIDISDPDDPIFTNEILNSWLLELNWSWWLEIEWNYLYVSALVDDWVQIFDISDWANPVATDNITNSTPTKLNWARNSVLDEWYMYVWSANDDSVQILDISDPNNISDINYYRDNFNMNWVNWITKDWNNIFTANYNQSSLEILKENYFTDSPYITTNTGVSYVWEINNFSEVLWAYNAWNVSYQISKDDWSTWYYYDWSSWETTTLWVSESSSASLIDTNLSSFNLLSWWTNDFTFKAFLTSNSNQKVELSEVNIDFSDITSPIVTTVNHSSWSLLPWWTHNIIFNYSDEIWWSGINTSSWTISLQRWNGVWWDPDISNTWYLTWSVTSSWATFPTNDLGYWKYKTSFNISDNAWNISNTFDTIFYIDRPEFSVSTPVIDIGTIDSISANFSSEALITVKTIWAWFDVLLNTNTDLEYSTNIIESWEWTKGYWYDKEIYSWNINIINIDEIISSEVENINTNGELNTYTYKIKFWAISELWTSAWDYEWEVDFKIELDY